MGIWSDVLNRGFEWWVKLSGTLTKTVSIDPADGGLVLRSGPTYTTKIIGDSSATSNTTLIWPTTFGVAPISQSVTSFHVEISTASDAVLTINKINNTLVQNTWTTVASFTTARLGVGGAGTQNAALIYGGSTTGVVNLTDKYNGIVWNAAATNTLARDGIGGCGTQNAAIGAGGSTGSPSSTCDKFDGYAWASASTLSVARSWQAAAGIQNAAFAFGGSTGAISAVTDRYNGVTWAASSAPLVVAKQMNAGTGTANAILSIGGYTSTPSGIGTTEKNNGYVWSLTGSLNVTRYILGSAGTQNSALSFGGYNNGGVGTTEKFNGSVWNVSTSLNVTRYYISGTGTQNAALSFGGSTGSVSNVTEKFNGEVLFDVASSIKNTAKNLMLNQQYEVVNSGSQIEVDIVPLSFIDDTTEKNHLTEMDRLQDSNCVWITRGGLNQAREMLAGAGTANAALSIAGSTTGSDNVATTETYNGTSNTWSNLGAANLSVRRGLCGCGLQNAALCFSGYVSAGITLTDKFNGSTWTSVNPCNTIRYIAGGCGIQNAAVLVGGTSGVTSEIFDGTNWAISGSVTLSRYWNVATGSRNAALNMGGYQGGGYWFSICEKFNGNTWTACSSMLVNPSGNTSISSLYGPSGGASSGTVNSALYFGGDYAPTYPFASTTLFTTWGQRFNGNTWSLMTGLNTVRRALASAGTSNLALSFGGNTNPAGETTSSVTEKFINNCTFVTAPVQILI